MCPDVGPPVDSSFVDSPGDGLELLFSQLVTYCWSSSKCPVDSSQVNDTPVGILLIFF